MHPLLAGRLRLALYLALWLGIGLMLAALLSLLQPRPLAQTLAFAAPLTLVYAFVCLSAWWVCRSHPLGTTPPARVAAGLAGAALQAGALWVAMGAGWAFVLSRLAHAAPDRAGLVRDLVVLFVAGLVLYAQSIALHYMLLAIESARTAERRVLESQVSARE